jgi:hypothetical protein
MRPGVRTGYQARPEGFADDYMWYSPTETSTCREILRFASEWFNSFWMYSRTDYARVLVDFGAGAGKVNLIAAEVGNFDLTVAFELDDDLVKVSEKNFLARSSQLSKRSVTAVAMKGDVVDPSALKDLRGRIEAILPGKKYCVFAYNKNSYGPGTLNRALQLLETTFTDYVYLYQNPVHAYVLEELGLKVHRRIIDSGLEKNRDWLIATKGFEY